MRQVNYPSIRGIDSIVTTMKHLARYIGQDEDGKAIYDRTLKLPVVKFTGTIKLHGTNASVAMNADEFWAQSRERIITIGDDNAGFASFAHKNKDYFTETINKLADIHNINLYEMNINIYGEWAGRGVPGGSAGIRKFPKGFYIFGAKVSKKDVIISDAGEDVTPNYWIDHSWIHNNKEGIFNITQFPTIELDFDFKLPEEGLQKIHDLTMEVERDCPVSRKLFNDSSDEYKAEYEEEYFNEFIGEGIVWKSDFNGKPLIFKSKGLKHAPGTKIKEVKVKDIEKGKLIREVAISVTPEWRLDQFLVKIFDLGNGGTLETTLLGKYISAVMKDVYDEESDYIAKQGLTAKELNSTLGMIARDYFFNRQKQYISESGEG